MAKKKGFEQARGVLARYGPWICPDCGTEVPSSIQIDHMLGRGCVEILKAQKADLKTALVEARESLGAIREGIDEIGKMCQRLDKSATDFDLWMTIRNIQGVVATEQAVRAAEDQCD